jgi:hypothetical protein
MPSDLLQLLYNRMSELSPGGLEAAAIPNKISHASGWRAFFCVFLVGVFIFGNLLKGNYSYDMQAGKAAGSFAVLVAALCAIKWRKLERYWSIVWRLYLVTLVTAFVVGFCNGGAGVAGYAVGVALPAGLMTVLPGTALFYWRNFLTNIVFGLICALFFLGIFLVTLGPVLFS